MVSRFLVSFLTHTEQMSASRLALAVALQHTSLKQKGGAPDFFFHPLDGTAVELG